jgi:hypothetical protein
VLFLSHLQHLVDDVGVKIARDEAGADALDLVWPRLPARDDWTLRWLHGHDLGQQAASQHLLRTEISSTHDYSRTMHPDCAPVIQHLRSSRLSEHARHNASKKHIQSQMMS